MAGRIASVLLLQLLLTRMFLPLLLLLQDEISTGLDSSTTYLIVRCIRNYVHLLDVSSGVVVEWIVEWSN